MIKTILQIFAISLLLVFTASDNLLAQGNSGKHKTYKSKKENAGPPAWAPAHGYRAKTRYVYFKDHGVYYDHDRGVYISLSGGNWKISAKLPPMLEGINLKGATKVDIDYDGDDPQRYFKKHKKKYQ